MINSNTLSRNLIGSFGALVLGFAFVGAATAPANAATVDATSISVSYSDLNMNSTAGQSAYAARVKAAAKSVCATDLGDVASRSAEQACIDAAVAGAKLPAASHS
ncbi:MAG TPA: UrcA family protein [Polymorphobacter sp.]|nr:UrcA family protein [Polymorphobacter sp.]